MLAATANHSYGTGLCRFRSVKDSIDTVTGRLLYHRDTSFINTLGIGDLPEFLSHEHQQLREEAAERLDDCLKDIPLEDLPELLTDSDSIIRDTAISILVIQSIEAGYGGSLDGK